MNKEIRNNLKILDGYYYISKIEEFQGLKKDDKIVQQCKICKGLYKHNYYRPNLIQIYSRFICETCRKRLRKYKPDIEIEQSDSGYYLITTSNQIDHIPNKSKIEYSCVNCGSDCKINVFRKKEIDRFKTLLCIKCYIKTIAKMKCGKDYIFNFLNFKTFM